MQPDNHEELPQQIQIEQHRPIDINAVDIIANQLNGLQQQRNNQQIAQNQLHRRRGRPPGQTRPRQRPPEHRPTPYNLRPRQAH